MSNPEQSLAISEAKLRSIYTQAHEICELSKIITDANTALFLTKAKRLDNLRENYALCLAEHETLKLSIDANYKPSMSSKLTALNDIIDQAATIRDSILERKEHDKLVSNTIANANNSSALSRNKIKIEPIKLAHFDGSPERWTPFYQLYVELIHLNEDYSDLQKVTFLTSHLTGSALSIVTGIPPTAENYTTLFNTLVSRFEDKRTLGTYYLDKIMNFKASSQESERNLNAFLETFVESAEAIKNLGITDLFEFVLLYLAGKKLDVETMRLFDMAHRNENIPSFTSLVDFVRSHVKIVGRHKRYSAPPSHSNAKSSPSPPVKTANTYVVQSSDRPPSALPLSKQAGTCGCSAKHRQLYRCEQFTRLDPAQRWAVVKDRQACINCLSFRHRRLECRSQSKCSVAECGRSHHSLLHRTDGEFGRRDRAESNATNGSTQRNGPNGSSSQASSDTKTVACCSTDLAPHSSAVLLATAIVRIRDHEGTYQEVRCLLDPGSESHLISNEACTRLGLPVHPAPIAIKGLGSADIDVRGGAMFTFFPRHNENSSYEISALVVDRLIEALPTAPVDVSNLQHLAHLNLADPNCGSVGTVDLLIGAELWPHIVGHRKVFGPSNTPVGLQSTLGYLVMGRVSTPAKVLQKRSFVVTKAPDSSLDDLLKRFWELDIIPSATLLSPDEQKCEEIFMDTHTRGDDGRYMVHLPFKKPPALLGNSLNSSRARFISLERRLLKSPEVHAQYGEVLKEYLSDGTILKLDSIDHREPAFYLPHHGVYKPSSLTTPLRLVYNASARSSSGKSLNDLLYTGEKLQNGIFSILLNMRLFQHVLCTDIRRMFLRIRVTPEHRRFLRFLWRYSPQDPLEVYEFQSLVFGLTCSPFLAQRVIKALNHDEGHRFPMAKAVIERDIYIDDLTISVPRESQLFDLYDQLTGLLAAGGFSLSKWSSTSEQLLGHIPKESRQTHHVSFDKDESTKVLGVHWHPLTDVFSCSIEIDDEAPTKRRMASLLARIFDPLGLLSPVTVQVKLLLRDMWEKTLDWDAELPDELRDRCLLLKRSLATLSDLSIPRFSTVTEKAETMLVGFADASEKAYGGVVYVRTHAPPAMPQVRLLCSKSVVAPMKTETIPRLELCAAVHLAKLMRHVIETYQDRHTFDKVLAFSDSTVTLHWIRSHPSQWKVFVANRVAKIHEHLDPSCWHFVPGTCNPADVLSRGCSPEELLNHPLWYSGPEWLALEEKEWSLPDPIDPQNDILSLEVKPHVLVVTQTASSSLEPMLERVSQYRRLLRATAQVFRVCRNKNIGEPIVSYEELCDAERYWVRLIQHKHFADLKIRLKKQKPLPDEYKMLDVFMSDEGVLRVGGRIRHADISIDRKHPILLPKHDRFVNLLIDQYHVDHFHAGAHALMSYISQKFWIMSAGVRIRSRLRCCYQCFRVDPKEKKTKMADLPKMRVQGYKCFATTGVDYAGPFQITWSRRRGVRTEKAYVCLFICFAVKAVHLELVTDLSTDNFLSAFKRFLARRGPCAQMVSDCGSNFIGAKRELAELHQLMSTRQFNEKVGNDLAARGVEWKMNPARAPHFGGLWESNIKSMKTHLKKVIGTQILTYEEMNTVLVQIEAVMNSRPLCRRLLADPTAPAALTPAHFLTLGSSLAHLPVEDVMEVPQNRLSRYQLIDRFIQEFWKRWRNEYLHTLQLRGKWHDATTPIEIGTVVILKEDNVAPLHWPLGIIEEVHPGQDKEVRVVTVRTATSTLKRPVIKVCPLPSPE